MYDLQINAGGIVMFWNLTHVTAEFQNIIL